MYNIYKWYIYNIYIERDIYIGIYIDIYIDYIDIDIYIDIYIYIYIKHIHWLNLIKGLSKWLDFIRKLITSLVMSWLKEIGLFGEEPYNEILTSSLAINLKKDELILLRLWKSSNLWEE